LLLTIFLLTSFSPYSPYMVFYVYNFQFGLGAQIGFTIALATYLLNLRMGYIYLLDPDQWIYAMPRKCKKGWQCFFRPFSVCQDYPGKRGWRMKLLPKHTPHQTLGFPQRFPIPLRYMPMGQLEYYTVLTKYVWRPQPWVEKILEAKAKEVDWTVKTIAMHVRFGPNKALDIPYMPDQIQRDFKKLGEHTLGYINFTDYMREADVMRAKYGVDRIILGTDNQRVIEDSKTKYNNWTFIYTQSYVNMTNYAMYMMGQQDGLDPISTIDLLSRAHFLIGTLSSCFMRMIYQLGRSRGNFIRPHTFKSLDVDWYPDP
jgi:hypothetical protein